MKTRRRSAQLHLAAFAVLLLAGCGGKPKPPAPPPPEVVVASPVSKEITDHLDFTGRTEAVASVEIYARVSGYLEKVAFQDGQLVNKGDLLFVIDQRPFQNALDSAKAGLQQAETKLALAKSEFDRIDTLRKNNAASQQDYEGKLAAFKSAEADVAKAQSTFQTAQLDREYSEIRSPIAGKISRAAVTAGNLITAGAASGVPLTTIVSQDPIYAVFDSDETSVLHYQEMRRQRKREGRPDAEDLPIVFLGLSSEKDYPHQGQIDFVDNQINPTTGTLKVRGTFPNPESVLTPGMFVRLRGPSSDPYTGLLIPEKALGRDQDKTFVYVVNAKSEIEYRPVVPGPKEGDLLVIREGLKPDDKVVTEGLLKIRPGAVVKIKTPATPPPTKN